MEIHFDQSLAYLGAFRVQPGKFWSMLLACIFYRLLTQGHAWVDRGTKDFERRREERELAALQRKALSLGMQLVPAT